MDCMISLYQKAGFYPNKARTINILFSVYFEVHLNLMRPVGQVDGALADGLYDFFVSKGWILPK